MDQFLDAPEDAAPQATLREVPEEALDEVEPGAAGREEWATDWSTDGRFLLFERVTFPRSLWILPLAGGREAREYSTSQFGQLEAAFSPDGRWVAYTTNESGRFEVHVRSFPDPGRNWVISKRGGRHPVWSADGRELFYREGDRMMVATVQTQPTFHSLPSRVLFEARFGGWGIYDVAPDGQRFVAVLDDEEELEPDQIVYIPDFADELKAKMAEAGQ